MRHGVSAKIEPSGGPPRDDRPVGREVSARDISSHTRARVSQDDRAITAHREQPVVSIVRGGSTENTGVIPPEHSGAIWSTANDEHRRRQA